LNIKHFIHEAAVNRRVFTEGASASGNIVAAVAELDDKRVNKELRNN
jgi:hypothetical protein